MSHCTTYALSAAKSVLSMNRSQFASRVFWGVVGIIVIIAFLVPVTVYYLSTHKPGTPKSSLAGGYETEALTSPFTLGSKTWNASANTWTYVYASTATPPDAIADVKSQLAASKGYQVVATLPDVIAADNSSATLYRDLITEDVALEVHISPKSGNVGAPTLVTVTLSPMQGS